MRSDQTGPKVDWSLFPYAELVRYPLLAVTSMAICLLHKWALPLAYESELFLAMLMLVFTLFGSLLQLCAIPRGLYLMWKCGYLCSYQHWLTLLCGCGFLWLVVMVVRHLGMFISH